MISAGDRIVLNMGRAAIKDELHSCEYGSYEDHIVNEQCGVCKDFGPTPTPCPSCKGTGSVVKRLEPYDKGRLHIVELLERDTSKTRVYLDTEEEINEFFVQAFTGTFGMYHLGVAERLYKQLAPFVDAATRGRIPIGNLGY